MITIDCLKDAARFAAKNKIRSITTKSDGRIIMNIYINGSYHYYEYDHGTKAFHLQDPSLPVQLQLIPTATTKYNDYVSDSSDDKKSR